MKLINRTVWILSLVSLLADIASEMLYPVIPVYLREIGFSVLLIGILEGVATFTVGLTRGYFGNLSDRRGVRLPFIRAGYLLSAVSKPMMAAWVMPLWIFLARTTDRLGKGVRTAARDALLSQQATPATKAAVFGFHRGMDTLGAATGPLIALGFLILFPGEYRWLFLLAFLPGMASVFMTFFLKEERLPSSTIHGRHFLSWFGYWKIAPATFRRLVPGLLFFALFNSADIFLLIRTREITGSDNLTIGAYILYNIVFAISAFPLGRLADRLGKKYILAAGLLTFSMVYMVFAFSSSTVMLTMAFLFYGLYAAATEGVAKAWITNLSHRENTATAIGFYTSFESICGLLASIITGLVWTWLGPTAAFSVSAGAASVTVIYLILLRVKTPPREQAAA